MSVLLYQALRKILSRRLISSITEFEHALLPNQPHSVCDLQLFSGVARWIVVPSFTARLR